LTQDKINKLLFLGFNLINITDLKHKIEDNRDNVIFEIMNYYKKIAANFFVELEDTEVKKLIDSNNKLLLSNKTDFIDFIAGSIIISEVLIDKYKKSNEDTIELNRFMYITSIFYDLYSGIIEEIEDKKLKELYKNSFEISRKFIKKI
jgi:hypothetical protein